MCYNKTILKTKYNIILLRRSVFLVKEERGKGEEGRGKREEGKGESSFWTHLTQLTHLTELRIVSDVFSEEMKMGHFFDFLFLRFESLLS